MGIRIPLIVIVLQIAANAFAEDASPNVTAYSRNTAEVEGKAETIINMHSRMGIRVEYVLDRQKLSLWISPQAEKEISHFYRNFSNRDDHTSIFDAISLPTLNLADFVRCDYDAFHSTLRFKNQTMHIAVTFDEPVVLVWFEKPEMVDIKSDKQDSVFKRTNNAFMVGHPDRGLDFRFIARMGRGGGTFLHQPDIEKGRSTHARARLEAGQTLFLWGELAKEDIAGRSDAMAERSIADILADTEEKVAAALANGVIVVKANPDHQRLLDTNRRVLLAGQDASGSIRAAMKYIYYMQWNRDEAHTCVNYCYAGDPEPSHLLNRFILSNPSVSTTEPKGYYFGMLTGPTINKTEEDGLFFAVWNAFAYWTQTGDDTYIKGKYLRTMEEALDWLERYSYDPNMGLMARYHACETPLDHSRGWEFDGAVGYPVVEPTHIQYDGKNIVKAYDIYINNLTYATYVMLSAMTSGSKADGYMAKAEKLAEKMRAFYKNGQVLPEYGFLRTESGESAMARPYGLDIDDYMWALCLPPFYAEDGERLLAARRAILDKITEGSRFMMSYFAAIRVNDSEVVGEDILLERIAQVIPESVRPGKYLPMPYTTVEMTRMPDGDQYHDVRPYYLGAGTWYGAVAGLALQRLPFGISVRATRELEGLKNYAYKKSLIDVNLTGEGPIKQVLINGKELRFSYQVPEDLLTRGKNHIDVQKGIGERGEPVLIYSTLLLRSVKAQDSNVEYVMDAFGKNVLRFKRLTGKLEVRDEKGAIIEHTQSSFDKLTQIEFKGRFRAKILLSL